ncbi:MAG: pitrilysin family protein [Kiritimatiellia bacterium]
MKSGFHLSCRNTSGRPAVPSGRVAAAFSAKTTLCAVLLAFGVAAMGTASSQAEAGATRENPDASSSEPLSLQAAARQLDALAEGITRHQLDNGLVCLVKADRSAPLVSIQVWVGTGSAQEGEYLGGGLSHLVEHMIFKGTPRRKPSDISKEIDDAGGSINAYTTFDRTVFWADMPSENWLKGLDVLSDAVLNASFPESEWRREKEVIRREMAMGNDRPDTVLSKLLWRTAYLVHPYRFPVIGKEEIFNTLTRDDLLAFFRKHYTPDNMIIAIAGDIEEHKAIAEIKHCLGAAGRHSRPLPSQTTEPPQLSPRSARQSGAYNIARLEMAWHTVGSSHPDAPALDVLAVLAGGLNSSRLVQEIKERRKLAHSIDAWSYTPKDAGLFGISATYDPAKEEELVRAIETEMAAWRDNTRGYDQDFSAKSTTNNDPSCHGNDNHRESAVQTETNTFTAAETDKARNKITADTLLSFQTARGMADMLASGEFYAGSPEYFRTYLRRLEGVTPASLQHAAQKYLSACNRSLAILSPAGTNTPTPGTNVPAPEINVVKKELPNGLVLLCREDRRLPFVEFCLASRGGLLLENDSNNGITSLMAELLTRGTATRTQKQLAEEVETRSGALHSFSGMNSFGLKARCFAQDANFFVELLADCRLNPAFPEDEIAKARVIQIARIGQQRESPFYLGQEALRKAMFPDHPYRFDTEGSPESLGQINRGQLLAHHAKATGGGNMVLAVFGDISCATALDIAEKHFGRVPSGNKQGPGFPVGSGMTNNADRARFPGHIELTAPREQTIILAGFPGLAVSDGRNDALDIILNTLNGLSSDLMINIRDRKGLAYYTGAYHRAGLQPGYMAIYSGTRLDAAGRVNALILDEIKRIASRGVRPEEFERARLQAVTGHREKLQVNSSLAMDCALRELYGLGFAHALETEKRLSLLNPEDIRRAAAEILQVGKMVTVTVKPGK